jgi:hypothetical protein
MSDPMAHDQPDERTRRADADPDEVGGQPSEFVDAPSNEPGDQTPPDTPRPAED